MSSKFNIVIQNNSLNGCDKTFRKDINIYRSVFMNTLVAHLSLIILLDDKILLKLFPSSTNYHCIPNLKWRKTIPIFPFFYLQFVSTDRHHNQHPLIDNANGMFALSPSPTFPDIH